MKLLRICLLITVLAMPLTIGVPAIAAEEDTDIGPSAADGTYITFGATLPSSVFVGYTATTNVDLTLGLQDCCIRDDVVEVYINGCYVFTVDSRNGGSGSHPWQYKTFSLRKGPYTIELRNTISGVGPSGWYYSLTTASYTGKHWNEFNYQPDIDALNSRVSALEAKLHGEVQPRLDALEAEDEEIWTKLELLQDKLHNEVQPRLDALEATVNTYIQAVLDWLIEHVIPPGLIKQAEQKGHPMP